MIFGIGYVQDISIQRHSLGAKEARALEWTIVSAVRASADGLDQCAVKFRHHNSIVIRIGNEEAIGFGVRENLARKSERQVADFRSLQRQFQRLLVQLTALAELFDRLRDSAVQRVVTTLARKTADDVSGGIDQVTSGPGIDRVGLPDLKVGVVDDRMFDLVPQDNAANVLGVFLVFKFRRVDANDDQLIRVFPFQPLQIRNDVHTVDAAIGPKIEEYNFTFQRGQRQRLVRIQPTASAGEFRGTYSRSFLCGHFQTFR